MRPPPMSARFTMRDGRPPDATHPSPIPEGRAAVSSPGRSDRQLGSGGGIGSRPGGYRARRIADREGARGPGAWYGDRRRRQQHPGVGVLRVGEQRLALRDLDDAPQTHHRNPLADVADHGEVVRNEQVRDAELRLQIHQQVDHLGLHRDIQSRHRLVPDDQLGVQRQRPRDPQPLALTAGELAGELGHRLRPQADLGEQPGQSVAEPARSAPCRIVEVAHWLRHDLGVRQARVQGGVGIMENDLHVTAMRTHP